MGRTLGLCTSGRPCIPASALESAELGIYHDGQTSTRGRKLLRRIREAAAALILRSAQNVLDGGRKVWQRNSPQAQSYQFARFRR